MYFLFIQIFQYASLQVDPYDIGITDHPPDLNGSASQRFDQNMIFGGPRFSKF